MTRSKLTRILAVTLTLAAAVAAAEPFSTAARERLVREIRRELVQLPFYGVFDNLMFRVDGSVVTLMGEVTRPTIRDDAERLMKRIEGVETVVNHIEVLPLSPQDERIRLAAFRAIYSQNVLSRYALEAVPPIHIIVRNGRITLEGAVASEAERNLASIAANGVTGVFLVANNLQVAPEHSAARR